MVNPIPQLIRHHTLEIRVRYQETDAQARVHHANYLNYFELGRVEQLRASGIRYRDLEDQGYLLVVVEMNIQYFLPAEYDDLLRLETYVESSKGVRVTHSYKLFRDEDLIATGTSTVASISKEGKIRRLPEWLRIKSKPIA